MESDCNTSQREQPLGKLGQLNIVIPTLEISAQDTFTTFLYGGVISMLLTVNIRNAYTDVFLCLCIVVFLLFDWTSRILLPLRLPASERLITTRGRKYSMGKCVFEIMGVFCLSTALKSTLDQGPIHYIAFAGFLLFTSLWNWVLVAIMQKLNFREVINIIVTGSGLDSEAIGVYAKPLRDLLTTIDGSITDKFSHASKNPERCFNTSFNVIGNIFYLLEYKSIIRFYFQLFINHISWCNTIVVIIILFRVEMVPTVSNVNIIDISYKLIDSNLFNIFVILTLLFLLLISRSSHEINKNRNELFTIHEIPSYAILISGILYGILRYNKNYDYLNIILTYGCVCIYIPSFLYLLSDIFEKLNKISLAKSFRIISGVVLALLLIFSYTMLTNSQLIIFIMTQQLLVTSFVYFIATAFNNNNEKHIT